LAFAALFLTGTRANVGFSLLFLVLFYFNKNRRRSLPVIIVLSLLLIGVVALFYTDIRFRVEAAFVSNTQVSTSIHADTIESLIALVREKPWVILTGTGMGSSLYSLARQMYISSFEWSFLDLWRQMGIVFFGVFLIFVIRPLLPRYKAPAYKKYAYLAYLCIAATNPLLFSSTAFLAYIYMYSDDDQSSAVHQYRRLIDHG
jgi:Na+/melibiose symporter-like transporter